MGVDSPAATGGVMRKSPPKKFPIGNGQYIGQIAGVWLLNEANMNLSRRARQRRDKREPVDFDDSEELWH